jgi:threonine dehydrogenase-like Zn-dependent dehydrogenase
MRSVYFDTAPWRVASTALLGRASRRAYYGPLAPVRYGRIPVVALPGKRWVRVRNRVAGIGADDLRQVHLEGRQSVSVMAAPRPARLFLGREVVGEIIETGPAVQFLRVGDRVAYQSGQCCATLALEPPCRYCIIGAYALCQNRFLPAPQPVGGGWSEQMLVHEQQVFLVPDSFTDEQAALLEPAATAAHGVLRRLPQPGETALVIGAGAEGLLATQAVQALAPGGTAITVIAQHPFEAEMAARVGAAHVIYDENVPASVARLTQAKRYQRRGGAELLVGGYDVVYDSLGTSASLQNALRWAREGGAVVLLGTRRAPLRVDLTPIWYREVDLLGAWQHGAENAPGGHGSGTYGWGDGGRESTFLVASRLMREQRLTPERLITHRFPLREYRQALATARQRAEHRSLKVLLDMRDSTDPKGRLAGIVADEVTSER